MVNSIAAFLLSMFNAFFGWRRWRGTSRMRSFSVYIKKSASQKGDWKGLHI